MSSFPTQPAFIYDFPNKDFDDNTRAHPVLKWLETHLRTVVESHRWSVDPHSHDNLPQAFLKTGSGHAAHTAQDHFDTMQDLHKHLTEIFHVYDHIIVYETEDGWMSLGTAQIYYRTEEGSGGSGGGGKVQSYDGRWWEGNSPGAYRIHYKKGASGEVQLAGLEIYNAYLHCV